jgi:hypothetical protein
MKALHAITRDRRTKREATRGIVGSNGSDLGMRPTLVCAALLLAGCGSFGASSVARDRFDYSAAISQSWKDQMLLNLVKIRYADAPVFLEVASVINQYSLEGTVALSSPTWGSGSTNLTPALGASGRYFDRPTISYLPLTGDKFARSLMTPIRPDALFFLIQANWPVQLIFRICVKSINGLRNHSGSMMFRHDSDPEFERAMELLEKLQKSDSVGMRVHKAEKARQPGAVVFFRGPEAEAMEAERVELKRLLGLSLEATEFKIVYGALAQDDREFAILSRSMIEIMAEMAWQIEVPPEDVEEERVPPSPEIREEHKLIHITSSRERPDGAFASVKYRGHHFVIDDREWRSKRMFSFIMFLFALTETDTKGQGAPVLTVTAGAN